MKRKITYADDGKTPPKVSNEYLRRNLLHCKAVGVQAGIDAAIVRLSGHKKPPQWLLNLLVKEWTKARDVADEMARHRDEIGRYEE